MKRFFCILLAALLLTLAACQKAPEADPADGVRSWRIKYDRGVRYLSEGSYEKAIPAFEAAIKLDPKNPDAYRKLAEVYEKTGDEDAALRTLETGAEATGDRELASLAEEKQQALDVQTAQTEQTAQAGQTVQAGQPDAPETSMQAAPETAAVPDWSAQLDSAMYFGDASSCRMSREAAEAYAAALEQLPKTKDDGYGTTYMLRAMLLDPGDGYPLLLTCYAGDEKMYDEGWPTLADHDLPYQVWTFNGKTAERYPFEADANDIGTDIQFGSIDGKPGIYVRDGMSVDVGSPEGCMYYTVSEYQVKLLHHLWHTWRYLYTGSDPEQGQGASLQAYLDDGWVLESTYDDWSYLDRYELDGTVIRGNDPDYARLTEAYTRIQESFQESPDRVFMLGIVGYIPVSWSSPSELCAALRGESVPSAGTQDAPYSNEELERMTEEFFQTNYPNDGKYVVFDDESEDGGSTLDVIVRFQWSESSGVRTANVYVAHIRIDKLNGELTDLNTNETIGTLW